MRACAGTPRDGQDGTWITEEMINAYVRLHADGYAHSIETWIDGELVGGLYGLGLGRMFYGESMFSHAADASKIAFAHLCAFLREQECGMIDCQMNTDHLASLGGHEIERAQFLQRLAVLTRAPAMTGWSQVRRRFHGTPEVEIYPGGGAGGGSGVHVAAEDSAQPGAVKP